MKLLARYSWILILLIGLLFLYYAYDNIVTIPNLERFDPDRGWGWLTRDAEVVEYIQFQFRFMGLWVLLSGLMVTTIAATGFRKRQTWAWYSLLFIPVHLLAFAWLAPWTAAVIALPLVLFFLRLLAPYREFFPRKG
jgi:hypothetical protein